MAQTLADIAIKLSADMVDFENDMGRAARLAKKRGNQMKRDLKLAMTAITTASIAAGGALASLVKITANTADEIQKMSIRLGVSTEFLSQYRHVAELSGTTMERVGDGIRKMSKSVNDANNGLSTATRAFDSLGISLDTLNSLNPEQQFELIAERMSQVENQSVKAGAAMDIFGRAGVDLLTILNEGKDGIAAMREEAHSFGMTITQDAANASAQFNDSLTRLNNKISGVAQSIGLSLMPAMTQMIDNVNSVEIDDGVRKWEGLNDTVIALYSGILYLDGAFQVVGKAVGELAGHIAQSLQVAGDLFEAFGKRLKLGALTITETLFDEIREKAKKIGSEDMLPDFIKNSGVSESADELSQEITDLEDKALSLAKAMTANAGDGKFMQDAIKAYDEIQKKIKAVREARTKEAQAAKTKTIPFINDTNEALKEQNKILSDWESLQRELETPIEALNRQFAEQIKVIGEYMLANEGNSEAQEKAAEATEKASKAYLEQKKIIESSIPPYEDLIRSLDKQIAMFSMNTEQLRQNDAVRLLMQSGVIQAGDDLNNYADEIANVTEKLKQLDNAQSIFGDGINDFADLIRSASQDFSTFFKTISDGFKNMSSDSGKFADGLGSILDFGEQVLGMWQNTAGQDDAGRVLDTVSQIASSGVLGPVAQAVAQVATFIDSLTGGSLFGTSYQVQSSSRNINIGAGGAGGGTETLETRRRSLFRGTARRRTQGELDSSTINAIDQLFDNLQIAIQNSATAVGGIAGDIIEGSFVEEFDKDGNLVSSISTVLGRTFEESFEEFAQRLTAENILAGIGTVFDEVSQIAEQWRSDAGTLLDGAQLLLQAGADITAGQGLFNELQGVVTVITDMQQAGESMTETYERVHGSVMLLDDALEIIGHAFDGARVDYVRFAADITDAAGGLQQAASLWQSYFDTFYTEQELLERNLTGATANRDDLLSGLGIDSNISVEAFRELFESILPTLSADAVVQWLEAAEAIGVVIDLESELNEQREATAGRLNDLIGGINSQIEDMGLSEFSLRLKDIRKAFNENIRSARELGASERQLAAIQELASRQIQQAIRDLESDIGGALTDLYGSELDRINEQLDLLGEQQSQISNVQQASDNLYESQLRAIQGIDQYLDGLLLNEQLSPLNPEQQLAEAMSQFDALIAAAQGGDVDAMNQLPGLANTLLDFGQQVYASSQPYLDIFEDVTTALDSLGVTVDQVDPQQTIIGQNSQMIALMEQRNQLESEINAAERLAAATAIADQLRELASVTGESFGELAERLGIPVEGFLADLGVSLDTLTVETALALAQTAQLLGVEITELAASVGISLGDLADDQSLLNDALEQVIMGLPAGIADDLDAMLTAIENSTDPATREALLESMENYIAELPESERDLLAPFFEQIDPTTDAQSQLSQMETLNQTSTEVRDEISRLIGVIELNEADSNRDRDALHREVQQLNSNITNLVAVTGG